MATIVELVREAHSNWEDAEVLGRVGGELHERNRLGLARDVLARAVELDSGNVDAWVQLGYVHLRGYEPARGVELGKVFEEWDHLDLAEEAFREIARANPGFPGNTLALAAYLGRRGRWDEAETLFLRTWEGFEPWQRGRIRQQPDLAPLFARDKIKAAVETEAG